MPLRALVLSLAAALVATSCDKIALFAPSGSSITLTAPKRTLALNESVTITAVILEDSGNPVQNGTSIRFTTTLGSVSPVEVEARNGVATAIFAAGGVSGTAEVRATSGAAGSGAPAPPPAAGAPVVPSTSTNVLTFAIGAAAAEKVTVQASPSTVSSQGGTVTISAMVVSSTGQPIVGIPVTFSSDKGTLSASSAATDSSGVASVRLTTNLKAVVTATAAGKDPATVTVDVFGLPGVTLNCVGSGGSVTACSQTIGQTVTFTAKKGTGTTATAIASSTLDFGDGTSATLGTLSSDTSVSKTYSTAGTYTATLRATDVNGETTTASVSVSITARAPISVALTAAPDATATTTGHRVVFTTALGGDSTAQIESYSWNFGDGTTAVTSGGTTSHVYSATSVPPATAAASTTYTATVTVRATDGRTATGRAEFQVKLAP